ncbi:MAG: ABC transporter ATP-binding protein [Ruminococcaceae bacterium]|nr:ABC transporter ATP-binding protein [Oscillospiraceae bacterium]
MGALIEMQAVCKDYRMGSRLVRALDRVDFTVNEGEMVAILGPSGSGKSTLMNLLGCLDTPSAGRYRLAGQTVEGLDEGQLSRVRRRQVGFVFQGFHLLPGLTARENVELPLVYRGMPERERARLVEQSLALVGLSDRMEHRPAELSGGQQQRVAIARAVAGRPPMLLADEPTGNLDQSSGREIMALLHKLHRAGHTVVVITHDPAIGAACPRRVRIEDGRLYEE